MSIDKMLSEYTELINNYLDRVFDGIDDSPEILKEAMYYSISAGGKRIRPVLMLEFYRLLGGEPGEILNFAAAIEMIHTCSLIHDDLPCMDNDDMRRGKPSCHKAYGEDIALLAGDALLTLAFHTAADISGSISPERALRAIAALSDAAGMRKMTGGQVLDLQSEGRVISLLELERLQYGKSVAMIAVNAEIACILAGADKDTAADCIAYCENIGKAFQIRDDILDVTSTAEVLGKPIGSDESNDKSTYVSLLGIERSNALCEELTKKAVSSLDRFEDADNLIKLADMLCRRSK